MKTVQFRRYLLIDGTYDAFIAWWEEHFPKLRTEAGFTIEFAYGIPETNEFVWAVSVEGDRDEFARRVKVYEASDARTAVFAGQPDRVAETHVSFVDATADAAAPAYREIARS